MNSKSLGGIMLIVGIAIGGGMLALPVVMASGGFLSSVMLLIACWLAMLLGALLILEINLWLPEDSNFITMARKTLGKPGEVVAGLGTALLLYALLAAYIDGGTHITQTWLSALLHLPLSSKLSSIIFTVLMGYIAYRGIVWVDLINRGLLSGKMLLCVALIIFLLPFVSSTHLLYQDYHRVIGATTVVITAFGFGNLVPSLRTYFKSDVAALRRAIIFGSIVPLCFYLAWSAVVQGVLPLHGSNGLTAMQVSGNVTVQLANSLATVTHSSWITWLANLFTSVCILTSFLGVALSLADFLADGCKVAKAQHGIKISIATLLPPLIVVLFVPALFIKALHYAGILCIILLILIPALMAYSGRYVTGIAKGYRVQGGKLLLFGMIIFSTIAVTLGVIYP